MWEKNEQVVYTGQWMLSELNREFPTWLTIWPRDKMDKLFRSKTIETGNEDFDKRFNLAAMMKRWHSVFCPPTGWSGFWRWQVLPSVNSP